MKNQAPSAPDSQPISTHIENGRLAKGAKTPAGLARSARNATKHGLSGRSFCLLANEDPAEFARVSAEYFAVFNPRDPIEINFAHQFVEAFWLQQRCTLFIAQTLNLEIAEQRDLYHECAPGLTEMDLAVHASATLHDRSNLLQIYERYRSTHTRNMLRFHSAIIRHREAFGAAASLPSGDQATPESMFVPGPIGTVPTTPEPAPTAAEPPIAAPETTNYETNPLPEPEFKFTFAPEAPKPTNPTALAQPQNESDDPVDPESLPGNANREQIA